MAYRIIILQETFEPMKNFVELFTVSFIFISI